MPDDLKELERYKAELRREEMAWRSRLDEQLHSGRAAVDLGLVALRTAILVNAGAIVALLAFVGQLWTEGGETIGHVLDGMIPFLVGLIFGGVAAGVAYFYQSFVTLQNQRSLAEVSEGADQLKPLKWLPKTIIWMAFVMVGLVFISYIAFIWGTISVASKLS